VTRSSGVCQHVTQNDQLYRAMNLLLSNIVQVLLRTAESHLYEHITSNYRRVKFEINFFCVHLDEERIPSGALIFVCLRWHSFCGRLQPVKVTFLTSERQFLKERGKSL